MFASAIELYEPINVYKPVAEGIGIVDGPLVHMSYPWLPVVKVPFPTRMTIVALPSNALLLHSPIAYDDKLAQTLADKGTVRHIVSPNKLHYAHIKEWKAAFPDAFAWASPGVRDRAHSQDIDVTFDRNLSKVAPDAWRDILNQTMLQGSFLDEVVFFHKSSKTLILTDSIQSFDLEKISQPYRAIVKASGAYYPHGQMPVDLRATFWKKKREVRDTVLEILSWKPERIIISHGHAITSNAAAALKYAFRWAL